MRYLLAPEAKEDLRDIRDYLVSQADKRLARYVLREISEAFRLLASYPEAGHLRQDLTPLPVKFWSVFSYLIVYDPAASPSPWYACSTAGETCGPSLTVERSSRANR